MGQEGWKSLDESVRVVCPTSCNLENASSLSPVHRHETLSAGLRNVSDNTGIKNQLKTYLLK